jgi:pyridoxamine 5'-phosphate oxidase
MALLESDVPRDPLTLFRRRFREAQEAAAQQPDAIALATSGTAGPSVRMVLFKGLRDGSFLFYSNYESRKGRDLAEDNRAAIVFYWFPTHHQVRVSGTVTRLDRKASLAYFRSRPRGAQLSALASRQSRVIPSRDVLERAVLELAEKHHRGVPLPADWGGYALRPRWIEFWDSREDRLHDRLRYVRRPGGIWRLERLAP